MAKLAFDIDDTITNSTKVIKKYIFAHYKEYENGEILIKELDTILRGFFNYNVVKKFFKKYVFEMANKIKLRRNAKKIINKLHDEGNEIYIITARNDAYYKDAQEFCRKYFSKRNIKVDKIIVDQSYKIECCKENNIDVMIDDGVDTCDNLNKNNIKAFLFTSELNKDKLTSSQRVNSWNDVYIKIHEYLDKQK